MNYTLIRMYVSEYWLKSQAHSLGRRNLKRWKILLTLNRYPLKLLVKY